VPSSKTDRGQLAIVSPCSTCKNQAAEWTEDTTNYCPRRFWQSQVKNMEEQYPDQVRGAEFLSLTGTKSDALANPVYWDEGNSTIVWIAYLSDNQAAVDAQGKVTNPDITVGEAGGFDTSRIQCNLHPCIQGTSEADQRSMGRLEEWQPIEVSPITVPQNDPQTTDVLPLEGTVRRTSLLYRTPRIPVFDHEAPEGC
jgi:hypothetical protein